MRKMKLFILFALFLFIITGYKTYEQYNRINDTQKLIILNESQALAHFISAFRQTYQDAFLINHIAVDKKTINLLPVKTITEISNRFASSVEGGIVIRTVSDRPRNKDNMANKFELEMIQYFKEHSTEKQKFLKKEDTFYYTQPLRIKESCLKCHGKREDAIPSIRDKYENAYDYKLGEIRGLLNIEIKERDFFPVMYSDFIDTLIASILLYVLCLIIIYVLIKKMYLKEKQYTQELKDNIKVKISEIQQQKEVFETLFEKSIDGILILDNGKFVQFNERALKMLLYSSKEVFFNLSPSDISPKFQPDGQKSVEKAKEMISLAIKNNGNQFEWIHTKSNGENFLTEVILTPISLNNHNVIHVILRDLSDRKKAQNELLKQKNILAYQAHHDALTGLPNRTLFNDRLEHGIELSKRQKKEFALFFIDLDHFKQINDSFGHQIGDMVLIEVTKRLKDKIRKEDTLARLGGDEFTIIMEDLQTVENASVLAQNIQDILVRPIHINGHTFYTSCSIGISLYPQDDIYANNLVKYADAAMYKAKEEGRNNFQFYSSEMTELAYERVVMEANLRQALKNNEFVIYYQAQIEATTGKLIGVEALIRWNHPEKGLVLPGKFISLAEKTGLIVEIDKWVMENAMKQVTRWYKNGLMPGILALNLSMRLLRSNDCIEVIKHTMEMLEFKPEWLELEVTEGQIMKKPKDSITKLEKISKMGIEIAIDDFGTGYSSLEYLKRLPVDKVKIDQSFIKGIPEDKEDVAIVKAIIALAKSLGLGIIAEGVETAEQRKFLLESGCKNIQGYYYSKPMPAHALEKQYFSSNNK